MARIDPRIVAAKKRVDKGDYYFDDVTEPDKVYLTGQQDDHQRWSLEVKFMNGVATEIKGDTETIAWPAFVTATGTKYMALPKMSAMGVQNGFGAKSEWPVADWALADGTEIHLVNPGPSGSLLGPDSIQFTITSKAFRDAEKAASDAKAKEANPFK